MGSLSSLPSASNGSMLRPMIGAVIYVRVSDPRQAKNLSLGTQLSTCEDYCRREGFEVLERFKEEGESAKTADRTELIKLLTYCRKNKGKVHFVVVHNLTRFAREKFDHFSLRAHLRGLGISLRSATEPIDDSATGKLVEGVLASVAQFDNDVRSDRTRSGMVAALKMGRWTFLAPLGYLNAHAGRVRVSSTTQSVRRLSNERSKISRADVSRPKRYWRTSRAKGFAPAAAVPSGRRSSARCYAIQFTWA
jgi:DNA invertase Pin-like site-specific DNA recombinase